MGLGLGFEYDQWFQGLGFRVQGLGFRVGEAARVPHRVAAGASQARYWRGSTPAHRSRRLTLPANRVHVGLLLLMQPCPPNLREEAQTAKQAPRPQAQLPAVQWRPWLERPEARTVAGGAAAAAVAAPADLLLLSSMSNELCKAGTHALGILPTLSPSRLQGEGERKNSVNLVPSR